MLLTSSFSLINYKGLVSGSTPNIYICSFRNDEWVKPIQFLTSLQDGELRLVFAISLINKSKLQIRRAVSIKF